MPWDGIADKPVDWVNVTREYLDEMYEKIAAQKEKLDLQELEIARQRREILRLSVRAGEVRASARS